MLPLSQVMPSMRVFLLLVTVSLCATVSSLSAQPAYVAPGPTTVVSETDERRSDPPVHTISIVNRSSVPVVVWSISLNGCENVKATCGPKPVNLRVQPGRRVTAVRVEPRILDRGFSYSFGFSWRADSAGTTALAALASAGDSEAARRLRDRARADSLARAETGTRYRELTRDDFRVLAGQRIALRTDPDTVFVAPGKVIDMEAIKVLVVDSGGHVLGRTRWVRWQFPMSGPVAYTPSNQRLHARAPGRTVLYFHLAEDAEQLLGTDVEQAGVPIVVRFTPHPDAPVFLGRAVDAESKKPLACARVALEDSAQNVVASARSDTRGEFTLRPPIPGTYRVRVDAHGWSPSRGPETLALAGEEKQQQYLVSFTEQMLATRFSMSPMEFEPPRPIAVRVDPGAAPSTLVQGVQLGGSESMPILGIITTRVPAMTAWMQIAVDSTGRVDPASLHLTAGSPANAVTAVTAALSRMRFAPAKEGGRPVCEMMRMQVNFTPR